MTEGELADAAQLASLADETPEGRSIVVLAKEKYGIRGRELADQEATFVPFTAQTRMSGVDLDGREIRKGAADAIAALRERQRRQRVGRAADDRRAHRPLRRHAARRRRADPRRSASSISRTSSRAACGSGSTRCGRWASRR